MRRFYLLDFDLFVEKDGYLQEFSHLAIHLPLIRAYLFIGVNRAETCCRNVTECILTIAITMNLIYFYSFFSPFPWCTEEIKTKVAIFNIIIYYTFLTSITSVTMNFVIKN